MTHSNPDYPTDEEWCDLTRRAEPLAMLCSCGVPEGTSEATDPRDRSVKLPHHWDCDAVTALRSIEEAGFQLVPAGDVTR